MRVAVLNIWLKNIDSSADSGSPEGLRLEQWHNKNISLERPGRWIEVCGPSTMQPGDREVGERHDSYPEFSTNLGRYN